MPAADDDDVPALEGEPSPESAEEGEERAEFEEGAPATPRPARGRHISAKTRELFTKAAENMRKQFADGEQVDELVPAILAEGEQEEPAAGASAGGTTTAAPAAATPPPGPSLVPEVVAQHEAANARKAALDEREAQLKTREEALGPLDALGDTYLDDRPGAIKALLKRWGMASTDEQMRTELADLVTELSYSGLGVSPDPAVRDRIDARRANKKVDAYKASQTKREQGLATKAEQVRYQEWRNGMVRTLNTDPEALAKPDHAKQFPFLMLEDNPGDLVLDLVEAAHEKDGTQLHWMEAAKRVNDHLDKKWRAAHAKRAHLFTGAPAPGAKPNGKQGVQQGDPQDIRRSRTLTNAASAAPTGSKPIPKPGEAGFTMRAHREATKAKFRARFREGDSE